MSIPVKVPGSPWDNPADNNTGLVVNTSVPVPTSDTPYGGTPDNPVFFYNRSLGADDIVCGTSNWTAGRSCCPASIGILDTGALTNCRFRNNSANEDYWKQCTAAVGGGAFSIESRCWPFQDFLAYMENYTAIDLRRMRSIEPIACASVGPSSQWNYTATCCEQARGRSSQWRALRGTEDQWSATNCLMTDSNQQSAFNSCISQYTWAVCNNTENPDDEGGNGGISTGSSSAGSSAGASSATSGPTPSNAPSEGWVTRPGLVLLLASAGLAAVL